jgi:hypothetical protein
MKKIVKLTENDLHNIVKRVIQEQGLLNRECNERVDIRLNVNPVKEDINLTQTILQDKLTNKKINLFTTPRTKLSKFLIGSGTIDGLSIPNKDILNINLTMNDTKYVLTYSIKEKIEKGKSDFLNINPSVKKNEEQLNKVFVDELTIFLNCFFKKGFKSDTQKAPKADYTNIRK